MSSETYINKHNFGQNTYIWNPWVGCDKITEGCDNCYVRYPSQFRDLLYSFNFKKVAPGEVVTCCLLSDFFLEQADHLRPTVWNKIKKHPDIIFMIITKRIHRFMECIPSDWGEGYDNVAILVTAENQLRADERLPYFLTLPIKHKWVTCSPLLEPIDLSPYLQSGQIEHVEVTGERDCEKLARRTHYDWVESLSNQCKDADVRFTMQYLGHNFEFPDGTVQRDHSPWFRSEAGENLNLNHYKPITFKLSTLTKTY